MKVERVETRFAVTVNASRGGLVELHFKFDRGLDSLGPSVRDLPSIDLQASNMNC